MCKKWTAPLGVSVKFWYPLGNLRIPILLMTATFNFQYLNLIQKMLSITIKPEHTFWGDICSFSKRPISIKMKYSNQQFRFITSEIKDHLSSNHSNKHIIISSTAKKIDQLQDKLDSWLDKHDDIKGDTVTVIGNHSPELKQGLTTIFTNTLFHSKDDYSDTELSPRFLLGTPGCIGAGLDCESVSLVSRVGLPTSITHLIQEMGRCGRNLNRTDVQNTFGIVFQLSDYVYLIERLYKIESTNENTQTSDSILSIEEERKMQVDNIHCLCRMLLLNFGCWHRYLEICSASPYQYTSNYPFYNCNKNCPFCSGSISEVVKPVYRHGISNFIVQTLLLNCVEVYTPMSLAKKLTEFPSVGTLIYGRKSGQTCEKPSDASITIMQLICSNILSIDIKESTKPIANVYVTFTDSRPNYLDNAYWAHIYTLD